jgi:hypothetical protein
MVSAGQLLHLVVLTFELTSSDTRTRDDPCALLTGQEDPSKSQGLTQEDGSQEDQHQAVRGRRFVRSRSSQGFSLNHHPRVAGDRFEFGHCWASLPGGKLAWDHAQPPSHGEFRRSPIAIRRLTFFPEHRAGRTSRSEIYPSNDFS